MRFVRVSGFRLKRAMPFCPGPQTPKDKGHAFCPGLRTPTEKGNAFRPGARTRGERACVPSGSPDSERQGACVLSGSPDSGAKGTRVFPRFFALAANLSVGVFARPVRNDLDGVSREGSTRPTNGRMTDGNRPAQDPCTNVGEVATCGGRACSLGEGTTTETSGSERPTLAATGRRDGHPVSPARPTSMVTWRIETDALLRARPKCRPTTTTSPRILLPDVGRVPGRPIPAYGCWRSRL